MEEDEDENKLVQNTNPKSNKKSKKEGSKTKKSSKKSDHNKAKSRLKNSKNNRNNNKKNFKVRQYHAADFRKSAKSAAKSTNLTAIARPMSKAQLNLAIAKGLQNCKPIYTPPPPAKKATTTAATNQALNFPTQPLQLIQLRPLNMTQLNSTGTGNDSTDSAETASLNSESDYLMMPSLEVFLQQGASSPTSSSSSSSICNRSLEASSPVSSGSGSECFTTILEEPHILDDIQAVLMDADNFDILV